MIIKSGGGNGKPCPLALMNIANLQIRWNLDLGSKCWQDQGNHNEGLEFGNGGTTCPMDFTMFMPLNCLKLMFL